MPRIPCIKGCKYFVGLDRDNKPICTRVPKPFGDIEADRGCWWGERAKPEKKETDTKQGGLF